MSGLVLTAAQMRAADEAATATTGLPSLILMENAGRGVAAVILRRLAARVPECRARVVVVCGAGNNGGDGFVIARHLALAGASVRVLLCAPRERVAGDAAMVLGALAPFGGVTVTDLSAVEDVAAWREALAGGQSAADVWVDAIFGTGLRADVRGAPAAAIAALNDGSPVPGAAPAASRPLVVAVDLPSGLDADTGRARGLAVHADVTVTMGARKLALAVPADAGAGEVEIASLGAPIAPPATLGPYAHFTEPRDVLPLLPRRRGGAHKGTSGHLVVVAGSPGKTGAAVLVGRAAMRAGAGLVTLASTAAGQAALDTKVIELMTARYSDGDDPEPDAAAEAIRELLARPHVRVLALGPGIPTGAGMQALVRRLACEVALPMVIDADGLNMLVGAATEVLASAAAPRILTPHPGEAARLLGTTVAEVEADRLRAARSLSAATRAVVVLKGARTLVAEPGGEVHINPSVEPALATAGSGDVLTGVIGALVGQGLAPLDAARAGVFLHAEAGRLAAMTRGTAGVLAGDLPDAVATVRARWAETTSTSP